MERLLITLTAALLLAGCGPENGSDAATQNANAARTAAAVEQRAAQERQQAETKLREQEARIARWQFAAMLAVSGAAFALIIGTILGSRARHDSDQ